MPIFIIPGVIVVAILIFWQFYCKRSIIQSRILDLKMKSPVFNNMKSMMNGIIHYRIYGTENKMAKNMQRTINDSMRCSNTCAFSQRIFGVYIGYVTVIIIAIGIFIGIKFVPDAGLFGLLIGFSLEFVDFLQWFFRQMINIENMMVSVERAFEVSNLPSEGELRT